MLAVSCRYLFGVHFCLFDIHLCRDFDLKNLLMFLLFSMALRCGVLEAFGFYVCEGILYGLLMLVIDAPSITEWQDVLWDKAGNVLFLQELQKKMRSYLDEQTTITHIEAKLKVCAVFSKVIFSLFLWWFLAMTIVYCEQQPSVTAP